MIVCSNAFFVIFMLVCNFKVNSASTTESSDYSNTVTDNAITTTVSYDNDTTTKSKIDKTTKLYDNDTTTIVEDVNTTVETEDTTTENVESSSSDATTTATTTTQPTTLHPIDEACLPDKTVIFIGTTQISKQTKYVLVQHAFGTF